MADSCTSDARTYSLENALGRWGSVVPFAKRDHRPLHMPEMPELAGWEMPSVGKALWSLLAKGTAEIRARQRKSDHSNKRFHSFCSVVPFAKRDRGTQLKHQRDHNGEHYHTFIAVVPLAIMYCSVVPFDKRGHET